MSEGILVFIEQRDGALNRTSLEAIVAAQGIAAETGQKVSAMVLGSGVSDVATDIASRKLDIVYTVEDDKLKEYTPGGYVGALKQVVEKLDPQYIILSHTYQARDFAPKLAAALDKTFVTDCIGYRVDAGNIVFTRQVFQGKLNTDVRVTGAPPIFASFQAGAYRGDKAEAGKAEVQAIEIDMSN